MILLLLMSFPDSPSQPPKSGGPKLNGQRSMNLLYSVLIIPYRSLFSDIFEIILIDVQLNILRNDFNSLRLEKMHNC